MTRNDKKVLVKALTRSIEQRLKYYPKGTSTTILLPIGLKPKAYSLFADLKPEKIKKIITSRRFIRQLKKSNIHASFTEHCKTQIHLEIYREED